MKRTKYADRVAPHGTFTPLVCSVYGTLGPAAMMTAGRVARSIDPEGEERHASKDLHRVMIQAAVVKATSLCLRARSRSKLPELKPQDRLEDAVGWLAEAAPRGDSF